MVSRTQCHSLAVTLLAAVSLVAAVVDNSPLVNDSDDYLVKQAVWKKCHRKLTPSCLKLSLVRTVEMMSKDSSFTLLPGLSLSSNTSGVAAALPVDLARSLSQEHAAVDDLASFALGRFVRSLTLNLNVIDFLSGGNETLQDSVIDAFSGRGKGGFGGYGALAAILGGSMGSMMLAALAALAGKALMTSMAALMMSAMAAMKGGGGGGGEHKTYEVITKPIVSHINTHSSEVQHEHGHHGHYHKRSLGRGVVEEEHAEMYPYDVYSAYQDYTPRAQKSLVLEKDSHTSTDVESGEAQKEPAEEKEVENSHHDSNTNPKDFEKDALLKKVLVEEKQTEDEENSPVVTAVVQEINRKNYNNENMDVKRQRRSVDMNILKMSHKLIETINKQHASIKEPTFSLREKRSTKPFVGNKKDSLKTQKHDNYQTRLQQREERSVSQEEENLDVFPVYYGIYKSDEYGKNVNNNYKSKRSVDLTYPKNSKVFNVYQNPEHNLAFKQPLIVNPGLNSLRRLSKRNVA